MIYLKSESEIEKMRESTRIVSQTLGKIAQKIEPGVMTAALDRIAEDFIRNRAVGLHLRGMVPHPIHFRQPYVYR